MAPRTWPLNRAVANRLGVALTREVCGGAVDYLGDDGIGGYDSGNGWLA